MKEMEEIFVIGAKDIRAKIGKLFSSAGLKVTLGDVDYCGETASANIVLECLPDGVEPRKEALREWEKKAPSNVILATAASWGITEISAVTGRPEVVIGLNFVFNPFEEKCVVQIVKGLETSEETIETCRSLIEKTGALAIVVEDSPGLVLDRVVASVINEAATMYATGVASIEDIDRITKSCLNWPMGPFEFADTLGLDNILATLETLSQREGPRFLPCRLFREMAAMQKLGKKTGRGFYVYN